MRVERFEQPCGKQLILLILSLPSSVPYDVPVR